MRMRFVLFWLLCVVSSLRADLPITKYLIDPSVRGPEIEAVVTIFNDPLHVPRFVTKQSEVAMQMRDTFLLSPAFAPEIAGLAGFIPYVTSADAMTAPNGTLLIVTYLPDGPNTTPQYLVVPTEQVAVIMYSSMYIPPSKLSTDFPPAVIPQYNVDPLKRAIDLAAVFTKLNDPTSVFKKLAPLSSVGIFTTLEGPYNPPIYDAPPISGGFIPYVKSITLSGSYLLVEFTPFYGSGYKNTATIAVAAEQVIQMVYYADKLSLRNGLFPDS